MMRLIWKLTVASFKMFFREREALIWTFLFPVMIVVLFGFVRFDGIGSVDLGIVDESGGRGDPLTAALQQVKTLRVTPGDRSQELGLLTKGERDLVLVIPPGASPMHPASQDSSREDQATSLTLYVNEGKVREAQLGTLIIQRVLDELTFQRTPVAGRTFLRTQSVISRNLTYVDYLLPGVLAMSIMQMGIFGVAFGFVSLKKRGILRRLSVTPIRSFDFIAGQVAMRVVALLMQLGLMVAVGWLFLHLHFSGNLLSLIFLSILGSVIFLGIGFALAGISKTENQVAPLANLISLPMMLLSGVFFSRSSFPSLLRTATDFLPLTYLADAMRSVAIDGAALPMVGHQIVGLLVWSAIAVALAVRLFRWE